MNALDRTIQSPYFVPAVSTVSLISWLALHAICNRPSPLAHKICDFVNQYSPFTLPRRELKPLLEKFTACPAVKRLWEQENENGEISVTQTATQVFPVSALRIEDRWIHINKQATLPQKLSGLLLHVSTLHHAKKSTAFREELNEGKWGRLDFIKRTMQLRHETRKFAHDLTVACIQESSWPPESDEFKKEFEENSGTAFDQKWKDYLSKSTYENDHLEALAFWERNWKKSFCEKNPEQVDCN